jgi:hypothetical protein
MAKNAAERSSTNVHNFSSTASDSTASSGALREPEQTQNSRTPARARFLDHGARLCDVGHASTELLALARRRRTAPSPAPVSAAARRTRAPAGSPAAAPRRSRRGSSRASTAGCGSPPARAREWSSRSMPNGAPNVRRFTPRSASRSHRSPASVRGQTPSAAVGWRRRTISANDIFTSAAAPLSSKKIGVARCAIAGSSSTPSGADLDVAERRQAANDVVDHHAMLAQLLRIAQQLRRARERPRPRERHRRVTASLRAEEQFRSCADQSVRLIRIAVSPHVRRQRRQAVEEGAPVDAPTRSRTAPARSSETRRAPSPRPPIRTAARIHRSPAATTSRAAPPSKSKRDANSA